MDLQPVLKGELLELRPLQSEDFEELYRSASDPLIWAQHPQPTRYQREVFQGFFQEAMDSKGGLVIVDLKSGKMIGSTRYYDLVENPPSITIGYTFLERAYWGGVYNRELKKLVVNHALKSVKACYFQVGTENVRSQKAMEKLGAVNTGVEEIAVSYAPPKKSYIYKMDRPI